MSLYHIKRRNRSYFVEAGTMRFAIEAWKAFMHTALLDEAAEDDPVEPFTDDPDSITHVDDEEVIQDTIERCENCGDPPTTVDNEGVPLCDRCARALVAESEPDRLRAADKALQLCQRVIEQFEAAEVDVKDADDPYAPLLKLALEAVAIADGAPETGGTEA